MDLGNGPYTGNGLVAQYISLSRVRPTLSQNRYALIRRVGRVTWTLDDTRQLATELGYSEMALGGDIINVTLLKTTIMLVTIIIKWCAFLYPCPVQWSLY